MASVYDTLTALEKIGYVTDLDIEPEDGIDLGEVHKGGLDVVVENLSYRFPGNLQNDLQEVTFTLPAGQALCISGFGGSGKTMVLDVLAGFYDDFNGQIMVGGVPLREIKPVSLRILLGDNLSQESFFGGTLWDNLCMGNEGITLDEVNVIAARLELNAYLNSLPSGLFTTLHPEGRGIPRHVASRLMLLRLLLKKPKLIVLDDFLAPVDEELRLRIAIRPTASPFWFPPTAKRWLNFANKFWCSTKVRCSIWGLTIKFLRKRGLTNCFIKQRLC
jgi:ABC-type multidrug transport system fused ATPase/permease subunit